MDLNNEFCMYDSLIVWGISYDMVLKPLMHLSFVHDYAKYIGVLLKLEMLWNNGPLAN